MTFLMIGYHCRPRRSVLTAGISNLTLSVGMVCPRPHGQRCVARAEFALRATREEEAYEGAAMFRAKSVTALAMGLALLVACAANTTLTSTWKTPNAQAISPIGKSIAAVFITTDESLRRAGENALAADLSARGARGFGTYYLLPSAEHHDADTAEARLRAAGANAVVTMRVVGRDQRITYTPGQVVTPPYRGFRPYWSNRSWQRVKQCPRVESREF